MTNPRSLAPSALDSDIAVVVEIEGITPPTRFTRLPDALTALWTSMSLLPLGDQQADWIRHYLTGPDAVSMMARKLAWWGDLAISFSLAGELLLLKVRLAGAEMTI